MGITINRSTKDGLYNVTIVVSLEKFDIILLFLRYLEYCISRNFRGFFIFTNFAS